MRFSLRGLGAVLAAVLCTGCFGLFSPGGGGSVHHPPEQLIAGQATRLELELSTWGRGFGAIQRRYKDVRCRYQRRGDGAPQYVPMTLLRAEEGKRAFYECQLPPFTPEDGPVSYGFEMLFDGHANEREEKPLAVVAAP